MKEEFPFQDIVNRFLSTYEKAKIKYNHACNKIQELKTTYHDSTKKYAISLIESSDYCHTLPQIEKICRMAKKEYLKALNTPGRSDLPEKVFNIFRTAEAYHYALCNRDRLMNELKEARMEKHQAWQKMCDIAYAIDSIKEQNK